MGEVQPPRRPVPLTIMLNSQFTVTAPIYKTKMSLYESHVFILMIEVKENWARKELFGWKTAYELVVLLTRAQLMRLQGGP